MRTGARARVYIREDIDTKKEVVGGEGRWEWGEGEERTVWEESVAAWEEIV